MSEIEKLKEEVETLRRALETMHESRNAMIGEIPLRDWFAGMAIQGMMRVLLEVDTKVNYELVALGCYTLADAMLAERGKK